MNKESEIIAFVEAYRQGDVETALKLWNENKSDFCDNYLYESKNVPTLYANGTSAYPILCYLISNYSYSKGLINSESDEWKEMKSNRYKILQTVIQDPKTDVNDYVRSGGRGTYTDNYTPLYLSLWEGGEIAHLLLQRGADPNAEIDIAHNTYTETTSAICRAFELDRYDIIEEMLDSGKLDPNAVAYSDSRNTYTTTEFLALRKKRIKQNLTRKLESLKPKDLPAVNPPVPVTEPKPPIKPRVMIFKKGKQNYLDKLAQYISESENYATYRKDKEKYDNYLNQVKKNAIAQKKYEDALAGAQKFLQKIEKWVKLQHTNKNVGTY